MKYTKKQRNEIYKKGLDNFELFNTSGLCHVVIKASGLPLTSSEIKPYFPELFMFKPINNYFINWWDSSPESNEERKIALMFCIAMTE